ncbi:17938_t:CDS:2 [Entrophospora sp. SA101]|nr:17938_t:CDS:2 [Entrophospora sp. SA101]
MPPKKEKKTNAQNKQLISSNTRSKANSWSGCLKDDETYFETILRKVWKKDEIISEKVAYTCAVCIGVLDEHHDGVKKYPDEMK